MRKKKNGRCRCAEKKDALSTSTALPLCKRSFPVNNNYLAELLLRAGVGSELSHSLGIVPTHTTRFYQHMLLRDPSSRHSAAQLDLVRILTSHHNTFLSSQAHRMTRSMSLRIKSCKPLHHVTGEVLLQPSWFGYRKKKNNPQDVEMGPGSLVDYLSPPSAQTF